MEVLIEIFGEAILELFFEGLAALITAFVNYLDVHSKTRKIIKDVLTYIFFGLSIFLIFISLFHRKSFLVIISVSYLFVFIVLQLIKYINQDLKNKVLSVLYKIFKRIINYAYPILLIVFGSIYLTHIGAKVWLIVLSSLSILIMFIMDMYKLRNYLIVRKNRKV